jgi:glycopeptide antibiotics resistance protein
MESLLKIWRPLCITQFVILLVIYTFLGLTRNTGELLPDYNDLTMHFLGYLVAGISISFAWPKSALWQRGLFLLLYSIAIEIGQHFLPPRTFDLLDIAANGLGLLAGLLLYRIFKRYCPNWARPFVQ